MLVHAAAPRGRRRVILVTQFQVMVVHMRIAKMRLARQRHHPARNHKAKPFGVRQFMPINNANACKNARRYGRSNQLAAGNAVLNGQAQ